MPLLQPFTTSFGTIRDREFLLVEITDRDGRSGWGESVAFAEPFYNEETVLTNWLILEQFLIPLVLKAEVSHPEQIHDLFAGVKGNNMAKAALEGAAWDLYAKSQGQPLSRVIGGTKQLVDTGISIGIQSSVEQLLELIGGYTDQGYKRIKVKIKPGWDIDVIASIRQRFPDIALMADANSAYTLADTDRLKQLDEYQLTMIEQPLAHDDIIDHARLQQQLQTPICLDESIHSAEDARKAISLGSCQIINIKIGRVGGIAESIRLHDVCAAHGIPVWCGGMLESGIGRAHNVAIATLANFVLPGDTASSSRYWQQDIITPEVNVVNGSITVPEAPGIGYEPVRELIDRFTMTAQYYRR